MVSLSLVKAQYLAVAELVLMGVCSYEVVLKNGDTKGQLMSLQQTLRQEIHAKIGAQTAEESAKRKVCRPIYICLPTDLHHLSVVLPCRQTIMHLWCMPP